MIRLESVYLSRPETPSSPASPVFTDLNWHVRKGEKRHIAGKSGLGKTTLLKVILGFEPIDRGTVFINGDPLDPAHIQTIRQQIFYLSQDVDLPGQRVSHLIRQMSDHNQLSDQHTLEGLLTRFELSSSTREKNIRDLSGGERQRLGLVTGFLLDRPIWLLDEPTSALDQAMKETVVSEIIRLKKTLVIVSHDPVWDCCDDLITEQW